MEFDLVEWLLSPYILMFIAVFTGLLFGKVKFGKFSFGSSGALFTGLVIGWAATKYAQGITEADTGFKAADAMLKAGVVQKEFFTIFLILFVCAVGLLAAKDMGAVLKKYGLKFVILGVLITAVGAAATYGCTLFSANNNPYEVSGVYTGALTSSPGLAAALETATNYSKDMAEKYDSLSNEDKGKVLKVIDKTGALTPENTPTLTPELKEKYTKEANAGIGVGHAIGYPFGVLIVIIAMNFFPKIFRIDAAKEMEAYKKEMAEARKESVGKDIPEVSFDLIGFALACLFGYTIGVIKINMGPLGFFSLESTGGVLIGSLILGYIGKIGFINFRMNSKILGVVREVALVFFLGIVGLRYGFKVFDALMGSGVYLAFISLFVGTVAMLVGFFVGKYVFKINWVMLSGAICGGMTSTPGLGAAIEAAGGDEPAAGYGATYPFALLGMVIFTIMLHKLPM